MTPNEKLIEESLTEILLKARWLKKNWINYAIVLSFTILFLFLGFLFVLYDLNTIFILNIIDKLIQAYGILLGFSITSFGILASCSNRGFIKAFAQYYYDETYEKEKLSALKVILIVFVQLLAAFLFAFIFLLVTYVTFQIIDALPKNCKTLLYCSKDILLVAWFPALGFFFSYTIVQIKALIVNLYGLTLTQAYYEVLKADKNKE